jgi:BirA family biotin operon repressor/biotin-[acetyl-CoA-carboxylase] ligase
MTTHPPFDAARYHDLLRTRELGRNLIFEPVAGSTMDLARDAADHGAVEGTVALADEQTAGRGRMGRSWVTPPAANLTFTVVLRPPAAVVRQLAMIAPLAIAAACEETGAQVAIKWPNDVQCGGRKLAGILIETESGDDGAATVLPGIGLNVNFDPGVHDEIRDIATSLAVELGRPVEREPLLASLLLHFERLYDDAKSGGSPLNAWRARLVTLGQPVRATMPDGVVEGVAEDVDESGALLVRTPDDRLVTVEAGDVTLRL